MRIYSLAGFVALLLAALLHEKPFQVVPLFYGQVMRVGDGETYVAPDSPNGLGMDSDWIVIAENTWTVPNCLKHGIGLEIGILNVPDGVDSLQLVVDYPPMTLPSGAVSTQLDRLQPINAQDGFGWFDFYYFFDEEYERTPGEWRFRLYHKDKLLYDQAFTVVACEE
ncbi:DUF3859 domain-containing protein [Cerasicoccus maritimus]|uniref:DUF3859 domain-containing protein n=1 Tax=Cerasicoccus maritimus TaxID=490089 RepID=UPI002852CB5A|nr:DUF3859 domain-containing protein [Cerasicoccus maritimus]